MIICCKRCSETQSTHPSTPCSLSSYHHQAFLPVHPQKKPALSQTHCYTTGCWYMWSCGLYSNPSREPCTIIRRRFPNKTGMLSTTAAHPLTGILSIQCVFWGGHVRVAWKALQIFFILLQCDVHTVLQYLATACAMLIHKSQRCLVQSASFQRASTLQLNSKRAWSSLIKSRTLKDSKVACAASYLKMSARRWKQILLCDQK